MNTNSCGASLIVTLLAASSLVEGGRQVTVQCGADAENSAISRIELKTSQLKYQADQNRHVLARIESKLNGMGVACHEGGKGISVHHPASSCDEIYHNGNTHDGCYYLFIGGRRMQVYCEFRRHGGLHYLVFQRRYSGTQDFFKTWAEYKVGFGNCEDDYWLGLDNIHYITKSRSYELCIEMEDWEGHRAVATYSSFWIEDENSNYKLRVSGYSGTAGDSLGYHNNRPFSTKDNDNDATVAGSCAVQYHGGWWYVGCHHANLNGFYYRGGQCTPRGVSWKSWKNKHYSLKRVEMKMRPTNLLTGHHYPHPLPHPHPHPDPHHHLHPEPHHYLHPPPRPPPPRPRPRPHIHPYPQDHLPYGHPHPHPHPPPRPMHPPHW